MKKNRQTGFTGSFAFIVSILLVLLVVLMGAGNGRAQDNKRDLIITTLYDNDSFSKDLKTGWGYSCLISGTQKSILFDIGDSNVVKNMDQLKISPASIDVLVISHDHGDHTGGLRAFSERNKFAAIYDFPYESVKVCEHVFTTGAMGTHERERDPFIKGTIENALIIQTSKGLVVITGCAHPGVVEIVQRAKSMFPKDAVYLVMGGFHLFNESRATLRGVVSDLKKEKVQKVAPGHCTGSAAESVFKEVYGDDYIAGDVGKPIVIKDAFIERNPH